MQASFLVGTLSNSERDSNAAGEIGVRGKLVHRDRNNGDQG